MGMIEVVQDAETVAKVTAKKLPHCTLHHSNACLRWCDIKEPVTCTWYAFTTFFSSCLLQIQLNHGGSLSTLKDETLHDWLRKKNPKYVHSLKTVWICLNDTTLFDVST